MVAFRAGAHRADDGADIHQARIRQALLAHPTGADSDNLFYSGSPTQVTQQIRALLPERIVPAAVLVPLVERDDGFSVLLTQRADTLRDHAGQISFPGGRIEPDDFDAWAAALREAHEEIGLDAKLVEFAGYLPDQLLLSGYRVTPVVGFVSALYELKIAVDEVHDVFEVPLDFLWDEANHRPRLRTLGPINFDTVDISYGERNIWGATAGMLLTLRRRLLPR